MIHKTPKPVKGDPDWQKKERKLAADQRRSEQRALKAELAYSSLSDLMGMIKNTGMSYQTIEDLGGPVVGTLIRWEENRVTFARNETMLLAAKVCGIRQQWVLATASKKKGH